MTIFRTVRFDERLDSAEEERIRAGLAGGTIRFGEPAENVARTYALIESPDSVETADLQAALAKGHVYNEAIIALAIEPEPRDALPAIAAAFGNGAPSGVLDALVNQREIIVEFQPELTAPTLILTLCDVELRRFHGYRHVRNLTPLPPAMVAAIAARGLQAPEIAPDRILETLLEESSVE